MIIYAKISCKMGMKSREKAEEDEDENMTDKVVKKQKFEEKEIAKSIQWQ